MPLKQIQAGRAPATGRKDILFRIAAVGAMLLYCAALNWSYVAWISVIWSYLGFQYNRPNGILLACGYVLAALLSAVSPMRIHRVSQTIYWLLFLIVYVPSLFIPLYVQLQSVLVLFMLQLFMTAGMSLIMVFYRLPLLKLNGLHVSQRSFWSAFGVAYLAANLALVIVFHGHLQFASLQDVYSVRALGGKVEAQNWYAGYLSLGLSNIMNPLLIAYGLHARRFRLVALGIAGQALVYATAAMKSVLLSPIFIVLLYLSLRKGHGDWVAKVCLSFGGAVALLTAIAIPNSILSLAGEIATIVLMRTLAIAGLNLAQYCDFFAHNPHTYLASQHGINLFLHNPYSLSIGEEVANYIGNIGSNANAHFFAMDGIAAFGLLGIPFMGILCGVMFWVLDSCAQRLPIAVCAPGLTVCVVSLTNTSLFTTLLGGGLAEWMILLLFIPKPTDTPIRKQT